ncbi:MAG: phosphotransferase, partial [Pseudonocardia sp.]
ALSHRLAGAHPGGEPLVPVHGDLYDSQLLVDGGRVTGLLDVDTAGGGHRVDDWANLLAHLSVLADEGLAPARGYGAELLAHAERRLPRGRLRPRVAAAVLGLATGPFRVQQRDWAARTERRLDLAQRWLAGA